MSPKLVFHPFPCHTDQGNQALSPEISQEIVIYGEDMKTPRVLLGGRAPLEFLLEC